MAIMERYARQTILEGIGELGQRKLGLARVLVVGAGGLGCPVLNYLTAAGVGTLGIADFDTVSPSNLNRQILHYEEDLGRKKVDSAAEKLMRMNSSLIIEKHVDRISEENVTQLIKKYDVVVDCTDNFASRFLLSDCCYREGVPIVEGGVAVYDGILMTVIPGQSPCYRCLYPKPPSAGALPTPSETGILGAVAGVMGTLMAMEAIKLILSIGETVTGRIMIFDALDGRFRDVDWKPRAGCPLCSGGL